MKNLQKAIGLIFVFVLTLNCQAQIILNSNWDHKFVEQNCLILPMKSETDIEDKDVVNGLSDARFIPFNSQLLVGKETVNWFNLTLENTVDKDQTLYIGTTRFEYMTFWMRTDSSLLGPFKSGQKLPVEEKMIMIDGLSFFKFSLKKGEKAHIYLKAINKNAPTSPQQIIPLVLTNEKYFHDNFENVGNWTYLFLGAVGIIFFFNFLLFFITGLKTYLYYSGYAIGHLLFTGMALVPQFAYPIYGHADINKFPINLLGSFICLCYILVAQGVMETAKYYPRVHKFLNILVGLYFIGIITSIFNLYSTSVFINFFATFCTFPIVFVLGCLMLMKKHIPGTFFFSGMIFYFIGVMYWLMTLLNLIPPTLFGLTGITILQMCVAFELALFSLGIGVKINEMQDLKKQEELERLKAKQLLVENEEISRQRLKAEKAFAELKTTQSQLVQKEKLASLGELTAGIAHEIQNPLNFVNNFSELSVGIAKDLKEEMDKSPLTPEGNIIIQDKAYFDELLTDLTENQEKINHHGKRASSIVKGMLEHSRASTGERILTDINALADEYLRLSFHGMRAKDKDFNSDYKTDFDPNLPHISVVSQDIGRVLLNLINNAFYAVNEKRKQNTEGGYQPTVSISTAYKNDFIEIKVADNGNGIPNTVKQKIFQPFFTTKPTGEGTGLGLSLSYDIVTKGHGGTLEVESTEGVGSEFILKLTI